MPDIIKIGLTGGVGAGKSEVARVFLKKGVPVVDLDQVGREITHSDPQVRQEILTLLGPQILTQGVIDRAKMRALVFSSPVLKEKLERIIHPRVRAVFEEHCRKAQAAGKKLIICEAALLIESGYSEILDEMVVVLAPTEVRCQRLMARDHISLELAQQIMNAQVTDTERLKAATHIVRNQTDFSELVKQVEQLISLWKAKGWL